LLSRTITALLDLRLILCEPFGLPVGKKEADWESYIPALPEQQSIVEFLTPKRDW
jgi:hypothetical protein